MLADVSLLQIHAGGTFFVQNRHQMVLNKTLVEF